MDSHSHIHGTYRQLVPSNWTGHWFLVISQLDNLIRFVIQKKMADIHPLITVFGVVIGLSLFGFMGVIFGPLLLSLFFLFVNMFKKGYLDGAK